MRWLVAIALVTMVTAVRAETMSSGKLVDAIGMSRDGKRLALPMERIVDGASTRISRSVAVVDVGSTTGKLLAVSQRDSAMPDGAAAEAADRANAKAIDKVLADGAFAPLSLVKPGKELEPGLAVDLVPGKGTFTVVAKLAKQEVGTAKLRGRGSVEITGAVLVKGAKRFAYVLVRWSTSADGGTVEHTDEWVAITLAK